MFLWLGRVAKPGRTLSENRRLEIHVFAENETFPAKTEGLESRQHNNINTLYIKIMCNKIILIMIVNVL